MAYVLVGTELSQFTGKARALLRWSGAPFTERTATSEVYRDLIEPRIGYSIIPVLETPDGALLQDTTDIAAHLSVAFPRALVWPPGPVQKFIALLFELYADEWLSIAATHYRWSYNEEWAAAEFGRIARPDGTLDEQQQAGRLAAERGRLIEQRLGVSEDTHLGVEAHYEGFLADFSAHLRQHAFVLGGRPCLADFAIYGPLYGLYRDPESGKVMRRLAPLVAGWVERMADPVSAQGDILPDDITPDTLLPLLKRQMAEQLVELAAGVEVFSEWAAANPSGARAPRAFGDHEFMIGGRRGVRQVASAAMWRLQRVLDQYASLDADARARADGLLKRIGGRVLPGIELPRRLERRDYRLIVT